MHVSRQIDTHIVIFEIFIVYNCLFSCPSRWAGIENYTIHSAHFKLKVNVLNIKIKEDSVTYRSFELQLTFEQHWLELWGSTHM